MSLSSWTVALLAVATPLMLAAQSRPTEALQAAFVAFKNRDWSALAALIDPDRLETFRDSELSLLVSWAKQRHEIEAAQRAGRGWGLSRERSLTPEGIAEVADVRVPTFEGAPTIGVLAAIPPIEFFVRWCTVAYAEKDGADPMRDVVGLERTVIGELQQNDTLAHVLYRTEYRHVEDAVLYVELPGQPMVMSLKRHGGRWMLLLNDDIGRAPDFANLIPRPKRRDWKFTEARRETRVRPAPGLPLGISRARRLPREAVAAAFAAFERADWTGLATLVHPDMLTGFQRSEVAHLVAWASSREDRARGRREGVQVFMFSVDDSILPETIEQTADVAIPVFGDSATIGQLAALSPAAFFARWCETVYGKRGPFQRVAETPGMVRRIVGEILEGESLAHVLYHPASEHMDPSRLARMPLMRTWDDWGLLLNQEIGERSLLGLILMQLENPEPR